MSDRELQIVFASELVPKLLLQVKPLGFDGATFGECWRSDEQAEINAIGFDGRTKLADLCLKNGFRALSIAINNNGKAGGIRNSVHMDRLAIDVNLFRAGVWLPNAEAHEPLGKWWEAQHPLARWGGRWGDGNHYSLEHNGRK